MNPRTCIFLLNFQNANKTLACLESIKTLEGEFDVHLIDNHSQDHSSEVLREYCENHHHFFHQNSDNLGFAGGQNPWVQQLLQNVDDYEYFWFLNNDTLVQADSLSHLIAYHQLHPECGVVGSKLVYPNGNIQTLGGAHISHFFGTSSYLLNFEQLNQVSYINGASFCVKREVLEKLGFMDTSYFLYYEEVDYCYHLKSNGYELGVALESIIVHDEGSSTQQNGLPSKNLDILMLANRYRFHKKYLNGSEGQFVPKFQALLGRSCALFISVVLRARRGQFNRILPILRASLSETYRTEIIQRLKVAVSASSTDV